MIDQQLVEAARRYVMYQSPVLPPGYLSQPVWLREVGDHYLEFAYVYDPTGHLDTGRSYWMATAQRPAEAAEVRYVTWSRVGEALGHDAPSFKGFSFAEVTGEQLERWFRAAGMPLTAHPVVVVTGNHLPWNYLGLRNVDGKWVPVSGYVPSEGDDTPTAAREAADLLGAEAVVLEDAAHEVISVRGFDGRLIELPSLARHDPRAQGPVAR